MAADLVLYRRDEDPELFPRTKRGRLRPSLAYRKKRARWLTSLLMTAIFLTGAGFAVADAPPAGASVNYGGAALNWAEAHETGLWYAWGGAGPSTYDCSGAVMAAYAHVGVSLPHNTVAMIASGHLHWIPLSQVRRGDLLFFGTGHVEFATIWYHTSYGAHHSGTRVGWSHYDPRYWGPTMAFRVW